MFADYADVANRYEGIIPDDRFRWVTTRIEDVEAFLLHLVPSLADPNISDGRHHRAKVLVCDKVLEIYRNPEGSTQRSQTVGAVANSQSYSKEVSTGRITFTDDELKGVRERSRRRRIASVSLRPWGVPE